ncbi:MAG: D-alanyl-D-alanine carboxypeptidase family protein [Sulfuricurvum sp.]
MIIRIIGLCMAATLSLFAQVNSDDLDKLKIDAMVVKELNSQNVLYTKEAQKLVKPASLTKVITTLVAIEQGDLDRAVTITPEIVAVERTKAEYKVGDIIPLRDLIKAAMIESDNDAAMAIAVGVGGSVEMFVAMMNAKAHEIGMDNTHFMNPCGFDHELHYSTAEDLLKMAEYAIKNPVFDEITKLNEHTYYSLNETPRKFVAKTHNRLLGKYEYAVGIKTGYTSKAGPCFIARAKRDGIDCIIVMMNSKENRWATARQIFEQVLDVNSAEGIAVESSVSEPTQNPV